MSQFAKQHLIDPEICIRCYTCENTCPIEAITHNDDNVVVDFEKCNYCMDCIPVLGVAAYVIEHPEVPAFHQVAADVVQILSCS